MKVLFRWLVWMPLALALAVFFAANRQGVFISLDPFSVANPAIASPALPLWFWLCTFLLLGVGIGATGMWLSGRDRRERARADRDELRALRRQLADLRDGSSPGQASLPSAVKFETSLENR